MQRGAPGPDTRTRPRADAGRQAVQAAPLPARLGRFAVLASLGRGGEATVYLAHDPLLDRQVAVKVIDPDRLERSGWRERLLTEARNVGRLQHPNVVTLHDVGEHAGGPFLVFEYVQGTSLKGLLRAQGPLPLPRALHLARQVLAGVAHAHARGVAHLDLKPGNILVSAEDVARVTDFGTSRLVGQARADGAVYGSPRYLTPEQITGGELGPATDVFALGILLYELLTGHRPFDGSTLQAHQLRVLAGRATPPGNLRAGLDPRLDAVVLRALEREPRHRYPDAGAMGLVLEAATAAPGRGQGPEGDPRGATPVLEFLLLRMRLKGDFPALSRTLAEVNRLTGPDARSSAGQLANVVLRDYALTERLLRLANSAFYGPRPRPVRNVSEAIRTLGFRQVRSAATGIVYGSHFGRAGPPEVREATVAAFLSGLMARHLGQLCEGRLAEDAFIAGLFHNLGRNLVLFYFPEEFEAIRRQHRERGLDWDRAAESVIEVSLHALGAAVARSWRFPDELAAAMQPVPLGEELETPGSDAARLRYLACVANAASDLLDDLPPEALDEALAELGARFRAALPARAPGLAVLLEAALRKVGEFGPVLGFAPDKSRPVQRGQAWLACQAARQARPADGAPGAALEQTPPAPPGATPAGAPPQGPGGQPRSWLGVLLGRLTGRR
jgi:HD-like signal output (HDOD) protein/tRNA A-37 threonylcarbamoyl transferase component Bud32